MNTLIHTFKSISFGPILMGTILGIVAAIIPEVTLAQFYNGPGIVGGIQYAEAVGGVSNNDIRTIVLNVLFSILAFMALAAVVVIAIAGIYLVVSVGDESAKEKAKKIIQYAIAGLIVIALAAAIVALVAAATGSGGLFGPVPFWPTGNSPGSIRDIILRILLAVLFFLGLAAVVVIVIAGIMLVLSLGDESAKDRAKRIILYAIAGLIIVALAAGIVILVINATGAGSLFGPVPRLGTAGGGNIRATVLNILRTVLSFMALIAVVVIVIAGIMLVVSLGDEQAKDRAKRIIFYAVIGLLVILLASAIVRFVEAAT